MVPPRAEFDVIAEIEPPVGPDLTRVHEQVDVLRPVASRILVPDNHTGRATVSSIVVAERVQALGSNAIACVNARDRNLLGFRRDLLTARHLGVDELLLVYGDDPTAGDRAGSMGVRTMIDECDTVGMRYGVTTRLRPVPLWKRRAARLFVQVSWSLDALLRWRDDHPVDSAVYAGVMVLSSAAGARRIGARIPELCAPAELVDALEHERDAGVRCAVELVRGVRDSGAFAGVHLVGGRRVRETVAALADPSAVRPRAGLTTRRST